MLNQHSKDNENLYKNFNLVIPRPGEFDNDIRGTRLGLINVLDIGIWILTETAHDIGVRLQEAKIKRNQKKVDNSIGPEL